MPDTATEIEQWLRKPEAAKRLKISVRGLLDLAAEGRIRRQSERDLKTNQVVTVFHVADIDRVKYERAHPEARKPEHSTALQAPAPAAVLALPAPAAAPAGEPRSWLPWLTLEQAAAWSGLTAPTIMALVHEGKVEGLQVIARADRWRVKRASLKRFSESADSAYTGI